MVHALRLHVFAHCIPITSPTELSRSTEVVSERPGQTCERPSPQHISMMYDGGLDEPPAGCVGRGRSCLNGCTNGVGMQTFKENLGLDHPNGSKAKAQHVAS